MAGLAEIESAVERIRKGQIPPLVLIHGDQDYLVKQAYDRILEAIVPEDLRSFNLEQLDGARCEIAAVLSAISMVPMLPGPMAVGVVDARFFQSKSNAGDLLSRAKESWEKQETNPALRHLGRVLALLGIDWAQAQGKSAQDFSAMLEDDSHGEGAWSGPWLEKALAQGLASEFPLPQAADESGELLLGIEAAMALGGPEALRSLVFATPVADGRKKLTKHFQDHGLVLEFKLEKKGAQASQTASVFLRNLLSQRSLTMATSVSQRFVSAYGHDLGLMVRELDKLENWAHPRKALSDADVAAVGSPQPEDNIFELIAALGKKQKGLHEALPLLQSLLEREPAQMIFSMLANEIRLLHLCRVLIDDGRIGAREGNEYFSYKSSLHAKLCAQLPHSLAAFWKRTHPFVSFQALGRAKQFKTAELRAMLALFLEADLRLKGSTTNARLELERLCLELSGIEEEVFA
jgi:DNA polymerase III delta subunit